MPGFGFSLPELLVVLVVALVVIGPERLPRVASEIGRWMGRLRRHTDDLRREFYRSVYAPVKEDSEQVRRSLKAVGEDIRSVTTDALKIDPPAVPAAAEAVEKDGESS